MNRLVKKARGKTVYHGTSLERLKMITESGMILPQESYGSGAGGADENDFEGFTFLGTTLKRGMQYADWNSSYDDPGIVLEIDISEDALLPDDNDCPTCKTWKESADDIQQVKISGPLDTNYIEKVHFIGKSSNVVLESNFKNWEKDFEDNKVEILGLDNEEDGNSQSTQSTKEKINEFISVSKNVGFNLTTDDYGNFFAINPLGTIEDFYDIVSRYDLFSIDMPGSNQIALAILSNGDIIVGTTFPDQSIETSGIYDGSSLEIDAHLSDLNISNVENLIGNIENIFFGLDISYNGEAMTIDDTIDSLRGVTAKAIKRLVRRAALYTEQYIEGYPNSFEHVNKGIITVNVEDIIGMSSGRANEYDDNFQPIEQPDARWERLYQRASEEGNIDFAGPIHVVQVPGEESYFIYDDGNHRLSVAKALGIATLQAELTTLVPKGQNDEIETRMKEIKKEISETEKQLQDMKNKQEKIWDDRKLTFSEKDKKFDEIEAEKEPMYEKVDKLYEEYSELQQKLA